MWLLPFTKVSIFMRLVIFFTKLAALSCFTIPNQQGVNYRRKFSSPTFATSTLFAEAASGETKIRSMGYRELQREIRSKTGLDPGTLDTAEMRSHLISLEDGVSSPASVESVDKSDAKAQIADGITVRVERSPESGGDLVETLRACVEAGEGGRWKLATRKLKQLSKVRVWRV